MLSLDQLNRRQAVQIGAGGLLGLSLGDLLRADADASEAPQAKSVIHLYLTGGFSVQESWDPKPEAPTDYRGSFDVVRTKRGDHFFNEEEVLLGGTAKASDGGVLMNITDSIDEGDCLRRCWLALRDKREADGGRVPRNASEQRHG